MILSRIAAPCVRFTLALLAPLALAFTLHAQTESPAPEAPKSAPELTQTIFLTNATQQNDILEIQTDLRNMLPRARVNAVVSQSAITIRGSAEEQAIAQTLVSQLDRPRTAYRLTYTFTQSGGTDSTAAQHVSLIVVPGAKTVLKQGTRMPIVAGGTGRDEKFDVQYIDLGLSIEATITGTPGALRLSTLVEQSNLGDEKPAAVMQDPVIHQTKLDGAADLTLNKPLLLGSLDLPGSTHHLEVTVVAEPVR